jgi:DNA-binding transcriptional MerR regulator
MDTKKPYKPLGYLIGQAAQQSGVSAANIRYYEKEGLLTHPTRTTARYRLYSEQDIAQLRFIRQLRSLDMTLDEVRTLLGLDLRSKRDCQTARDTIDEHIGHVRTRLRELRALEKNLIELRQCCDGLGAHCHLIEALQVQAQSSWLTVHAKKHQAL